MFSHVMLGTNDVAAAKKFYDATLDALGVPPGEIDVQGRLVYMHNGGRFVVRTPLDGEPAHGASGATLLALGALMVRFEIVLPRPVNEPVKALVTTEAV